MNPAVVISSTAFNGPLGIVFDSAGDLWVANNGSVTANGATSPAGTTIVQFAAASLPAPPATGMVTPALMPEITLSDDGTNSIQSPWELAFDSAGNLWSSNSGTPFTLVEFAKKSLAMTGAPMPAVTISSMTVSGNATLSATNGLCIDNAGSVAATSSAAPFGLAYYTKNQLMTGAPTPEYLHCRHRDHTVECRRVQFRSGDQLIQTDPGGRPTRVGRRGLSAALTPWTVVNGLRCPWRHLPPERARASAQSV